MIEFNVNYRTSYEYLFLKKKDADFDKKTSDNAYGREVITTWRYDEEGNIVYYTYDKKTGDILTQTKYKNPFKDLIQPK